MQRVIMVVRVTCFMALLTAFSFRVGTAEITSATASRANEKGGPYQYRVPEKTNDGWETGDLSGANLDAGLINELFGRLKDQFYTNVHSVLLVRSNKLVMEQYFPGTDDQGKPQAYHRDMLHTLQSATKSVASLLIGIAIDKQLIRGVDEKISTFFPEFTDKDDTRLNHFLAMTAGLEWNEEDYADPRNDAVRMNRAPDPVRLVLERSAVAAPGTRFVYNSGLSVALGEAIHKVSGLRADKFAGINLFQPLGITNHTWWAFPNGAIHTGGGLYLRPRDMAKIGCLVLNHGRWQGKQIVSEAWIKESTKPQPPYDGQGPNMGYAYQWWRFSFKIGDRMIPAIQARGHGGQSILVVPSLDLVVVFTAWNTGQVTPFLKLMGQNILPAAL